MARGTTRRIALTGGIATGKSHVRARLETLGIPTIDADVVARTVVEPGLPVFDAIVRRFGTAVVTAEGVLDRQALGRIVFADPIARADLEALVHPAVRQAIDRWFEALDQAGSPLGVAVIPVLFEKGREQDFDRVLVTACAPDTQLQRVMARDGLSEGEARQRIAAQLPQADKIQRADDVINTDGSLDDTNAQVDAWVSRTTHHPSQTS